MLQQLEEFFEAFDIKPKRYKKPSREYDSNGEICSYYVEEVYPKITDRILLGLICIYNTYLGTNLYSLDYETLKKEILKDLIDEQESRELKKDDVSDDMKHQIQALFKEGR